MIHIDIFYQTMPEKKKFFNFSDAVRKKKASAVKYFRLSFVAAPKHELRTLKIKKWFFKKSYFTLA